MTARSYRLPRKHHRIYEPCARDATITHWFVGGQLGRCGVQKEVCRGR